MKKEIVFTLIAIVIIGGIVGLSALSPTTPSTQQQQKQQITGTNQASSSPAANSYTLSDVSQHNSSSSCWMVINNKVYDVTSYIPQHPSMRITEGCGIDATALFDSIPRHQGRASAMLTNFFIGSLKP